MKKSFLFTIITILTITFNSCASLTPDVEFFINKGNSIQYFFPCTLWKSTNKEVEILVDWLHRDYVLDGEEGRPRTLLNFTVYSKTILFRDIPNDFTIDSGSYKLAIPKENIKLVYIDQGKSRYSAWLYSDETDNLFTSSDNIFEISFSSNKPYIFTSTSFFITHIKYYKEVILGIREE